ncbi:MAG: ATPase [Gammaproteobacteria bacterium]|nr:ATPase [Gammaproteobacteria bacterium]MDE0612712.1 ATPase [Gammaproteobacteria bacterium]
MRLTAAEFRALPHKAVTLLGMSGVGKTRLSERLDKTQWFHYSGDYRIGTRYLSENILDNLKSKMMEVPFLADLLRSDSIYISNNLTVGNLEPVSTFLGKPGNSGLGGLSLEEFKNRLRLHHEAEIKAMQDVPDFIRKGQEIYGYPHLVNDAGGSLCELQRPDVFDLLAEHTLILYIHADDQQIEELCDRQAKSPKPLYYPEAFLDQAIEDFMAEHDLSDFQDINPDDFTRWAFPRLSRDRLERYQGIATEYGYTVSMDEVSRVQNADDFVDLIAQAIERAG